MCIFQYIDSVGASLMYLQVPSPNTKYYVHSFSVTHPQTYALMINGSGTERDNNNHPQLCCLKKTYWAYVTTCGYGYNRLSCTTSHVNNKEKNLPFLVPHTYHKSTYIISYTKREEGRQRKKENGNKI